MFAKLLFLTLSTTSVYCIPGKIPFPNLAVDIAPRIFEETINKSVECVRGILNDGLPEFGLPSFNPLILNNMTIDLDSLNLTDISGQIFIDNGIATDIASFVMTAIDGEFVLIPPTWTVTFSLEYEQVYASADYKFNITIQGQNYWGEGSLISGVENLEAAGRVRAVVDLEGVHIEEFNAPITLEKYNLTVTGLFGDEELSRNISTTVSEEVPEFVNSHPEIFTDIIAPIFIDIFNALVNDDAGIGLIKTVTQQCIIDIIYPTPSPIDF